MDGVGALGAWFAGMAASADLHHAFAFTAAASLAAAALAAGHAFSVPGEEALRMRAVPQPGRP